MTSLLIQKLTDRDVILLSYAEQTNDIYSILFKEPKKLPCDHVYCIRSANNHKVWVMNMSGEVVATFGGGFLRRPEGITIDGAGFVYVTSDHSKIVKF